MSTINCGFYVIANDSATRRRAMFAWEAQKRAATDIRDAYDREVEAKWQEQLRRRREAEEEKARKWGEDEEKARAERAPAEAPPQAPEGEQGFVLSRTLSAVDALLAFATPV